MRQLAFILALAMASTVYAADSFQMSLDAAKTGELPQGWVAAKTGSGPGSVWKVVAESDGKKVLAQTSDQGPNGLFNLCVAESSSFTDIDLSVRFKAVAGKLDQGGGPVWRYKDSSNYYIARMNPLEDNFRVYKVANGKRIQLASADVKPAAGKWHTIRVVQKADHIQCFLNEKSYLDVKDDTFKDAGKIGLWTKADAQTYFADLRASEVVQDTVPNVSTRQGRTLSEWIGLTKDKDESFRMAAAEAIGEFGPRAKAAVPALIELLKDDDGMVRWTAIEALGNIGPEANAAVPTLIAVSLKDTDENNVQWAADTLGEIGPEAKKAVPALTELLTHKSMGIQWTAAEVFSAKSAQSQRLPFLPSRDY